MGFGDKIKRFFAARGNPALKELESFAQSHKGIEGYIEPQTPTSPTTLLLVDRAGEHLRAPVRDAAEAASFCRALGIPVYDAAVIGYPKRMRDFTKRRRSELEQSLDNEIEELERRFSDPEET